ncbi:hypothetical protein COL26b_003980 [Colletotrichum chrysophilum]|uniref:Uncharacterized protein n=3 Tax=Colletotrichum gloeosporioides species complex TaxID=2707338 RepID=A0A9W4S228_9PEZI|nr:uncharacterized protein CGMCC3_g11430 [Colletotrichum fructicola]XP_053039187.1 uncharacterized protein COL26b_003980 [Colletotrichum chrysophilum]KAF0328820.1 hypothetical protein GQ607_003845 [Colletotrichum asianum]KAH9239306.1 hypothetical protein K456DRAFT_1720856 [Colletotrichum gloeosporioides 23]KAJ0285588.1 hypothetical protein COL940_003433 [Colletotrichum noveboracense]KAJ0288717.1 hypothetical protein CBS470a_004706 [Colletotrichum nupharicola]KAE9572567.1 hypothetical protein 
MKYSAILFAFAAAVVAAAPAEPIEARQEANSVPVNEAAMTDANGNIVPFNSAGVYQANKAAGL